MIIATSPKRSFVSMVAGVSAEMENLDDEHCSMQPPKTVGPSTCRHTRPDARAPNLEG